jgi:pimeloyl-ACP methyl ester carboxylesterase
VVLVHGLADRGESWAPMMRQLRRAGFHVYAPDLLGYGRSPKPGNSDYSIATQEQFVADFIQSLGLQKTDVAGWSMGGWIALKLALDHPEMVDRVAVYDSVGIYFAGAEADAAAFHPQTTDDVQHLFALMEPNAKPLPQFIAKDALRHLHANETVIDKSVASMMTGKDALDFKLPKLTEPLLIVWGSADQLTPLSVGNAMHAMVPASEMDIVTGCGHLAPKTCTRPVAQATAEFFKANPAPAGGSKTLAKR